jgi:hypothetical protein
MDLHPMWDQLQKQAQSLERSRMILRSQFMAMEQLLNTTVWSPLQRQMQPFEQLCTQLQEQFMAIEQLRLKIEALSSPTQLKQQPTQLKLMLELKWELERLNKLSLHLYRRRHKVWMQLMAFMLVQLPIYMLISLIILPLLGRASKSLPEEATAELAALRQRLKRSRKTPVYIQLRTAWHFLEILWAFYIKIKIDNLWLPKESSTKQSVDIAAPDEVTSLGNIKGENIIFLQGGVVVGGTAEIKPIDE